MVLCTRQSTGSLNTLYYKVLAETTAMEDSHLQRPKRQTRMSAKRKAALNEDDEEAKNRQSFNDFFTFCNFVLAYEEKLASQSPTSHESVNSAGESSHSTSPSSSDTTSESSDDSIDNPSSVSSTASKVSDKLEYTSEDESWNLVTCFCRRPFAGRPMIECSSCSTWIHMFCAKLRKDEIPEIYICPRCQSSKKINKVSQAKRPRLI